LLEKFPISENYLATFTLKGKISLFIFQSQLAFWLASFFRSFFILFQSF